MCTTASCTTHACSTRRRTLLDDEVYVFQLGVNCKAAFSGDAWFWHQDYPGYREDDHIPEPRMVNTLIFLDEVTTTNGPLMLVPGSHRHLADTPEVSDGGTSYSFRYADTDTIKQQVRAGGVIAPTGPPGSVIFMNVNTLHGSTANMSPWPRRMITVTFNAMSNKATSPSVRPRHIVADDRDAASSGSHGRLVPRWSRRDDQHCRATSWSTTPRRGRCGPRSTSTRSPTTSR